MRAQTARIIDPFVKGSNTRQFPNNYYFQIIKTLSSNHFICSFKISIQKTVTLTFLILNLKLNS